MSFYRRAELPGVEVRTLRDSDQPWCRYSAEFEFFAPSSWRAQVRHRRRQALITPGFVLCAHPGEVFSVEQVITRGSASTLSIDPKTLQDYVAEHDIPAEKLRLRGVTRMSDPLLARLFDVFTLLRPGPTPMEIQTGVVEFTALLVRELLEDTAAPASRTTVDSRTASRIRDCLHADPSVAIDLSTLAKHMGVSRFRILRVFKRRYGLPPHAYQLQLRLGLAQRGLREGLRPAEVAAEYGFVDQSHLTRHFKRLVGVTPAQYARVSIKADDGMPPSYPTMT